MAEDVRVEDVFDMDFLQKFQDNFARAVGMTAVTVDADGKPITRPTDWSEFCMKYTRGTAEGCRRCEQCDKNGGETAARTHCTKPCHLQPLPEAVQLLPVPLHCEIYRYILSVVQK